MAKKDSLKVIQKAAEELLVSLEVPADVSVDLVEEVYQVNIQPRDSNDIPLLIGYHGESLFSLQLILGQVISRKLSEWVRLVVEVGDYRQKRKVQLEEMAQSYAQRALSSSEPVYLPPLSPSDRRVIHLAIQERSDVESFSEGEGENRRLVIKPK